MQSICLNKTIRNKCKQSKVEWLKRKCTEIEKRKATNARSMHKKIKKRYSLPGCIKFKEGKIINENEMVLHRWNKYNITEEGNLQNIKLGRYCNPQIWSNNSNDLEEEEPIIEPNEIISDHLTFALIAMF